MVPYDRIFREIDLQNPVVDIDDPVQYYNETLLGQLCTNRVSSAAYHRMCTNQQDFRKIPREFLKTLEALHEINLKRTEDFLENLSCLADMFKDADFTHAFLKGSFLTPRLYPRGVRTSNDIDILVEQKDISRCQRILTDNGFIQGGIQGNTLVPSSRSEIINSRMNFGETIPFRKRKEGQFISVDINFSLDFKPSGNNETISKLLSSATRVAIDESRYLHTLEPTNFLIHLCCHLYKEATTYHWVRYRRDLMLYKFVDICVFFDAFASESFFAELSRRIIELGSEEECYYTFENTTVIFPRIKALPGFEALMATIKPSNLDFMRQVVSPGDKRVFWNDMNFTDWFFCEDRISELREV